MSKLPTQLLCNVGCPLENDSPDAVLAEFRKKDKPGTENHLSMLFKNRCYKPYILIFTYIRY